MSKDKWLRKSLDHNRHSSKWAILLYNSFRYTSLANKKFCVLCILISTWASILDYLTAITFVVQCMLKIIKGMIVNVSLIVASQLHLKFWVFINPTLWTWVDHNNHKHHSSLHTFCTVLVLCKSMVVQLF